ncbi:hypothetical protein Ae201684P_008398 [Aphanomyces euteiches]|uniref:Guanylate cyclase domain-containing protein n=1 Tax=Aphanomyces euteiches TaxID=100861 RepID=A0A6G0XQ54_9STRA|nr:hypothetical protein Ae201684_002464 [Aphanomyces euteiches]KAH9092729.1 hypothetical protein Ae201684P_008398 [Aphanomyces euteiches]KAH9142756.1 hypothetical protein AeRB84_013194 [Aphanomyces euteiches]
MIRRQQEAIISYGVLNSCPEPTVQRLLALAALICSTPISCLYLVDWDAKRVYTRAVVGHEIHTVNISFDENSSNHTFCLRCIGGCKREDGGVSETPLIVNNTELHVDFRNNEYVREGLVKFYLGVPLLTPSGLPIGAFCIIDSKARTIPSKDIHALTLLARQVMGHFEYLREACILANRLAEREALRFRLRLVLGGMLPRHFATSIKRGLKPTTDFFDPVTVFFSDIVGFKKMCATTPPMTVLHMLDTLYTSMDRLVVKHGLFKVETIGDVFLCCGGMLKPQADHTLRIAKFAVDAIEAASKVPMDPNDLLKGHPRWNPHWSDCGKCRGHIPTTLLRVWRHCQHCRSNTNLKSCWADQYVTSFCVSVEDAMSSCAVERATFHVYQRQGGHDHVLLGLTLRECPS